MKQRLALAAALRLVQGDASLWIEPQALALQRVGAIRGFAVGTQGAQQALGQYANQRRRQQVGTGRYFTPSQSIYLKI